MTTQNATRTARLGELNVKTHQVRRQLAEAHYESGVADTQVIFLEWGAKLRTAISLAESRLDASSFAHSMRVAALVGERLPGHRDRIEIEDDTTAGLKAMVVGVLHDLLEDQTRGPVVHLRHLADEFGEEVTDAVEMLTRPATSRMTYRDYIDDVSTNNLATQVKISDLEDHLSKANASTLKPTLRPRYERAWSRLTAIAEGNPAPTSPYLRNEI